MAQETAGTIGIPVIKNEILPYVVDYAKREQRAAEMEARRRAVAARNAAKQAAEDDKPIRIEYGDRGAMFPKTYQKMFNDKFNEYSVKRQNVSGFDRTALGMQYSQMLSDIPKSTKGAEDLFYKTANDYNQNSFRSIPTSVVSSWGAKYDDKFTIPTIDEFDAEIGSNPDYVDLSKIGALSKNVPLRKRALEVGNKTTSFEGSPLYKYEIQQDPILGGGKVAVPVGVDIDQVDVLLQGNKEAKAAMDLKLNTAIANNPNISPAEIKQKLYNDAFMPYKKGDYSVAFDEPKVTNIRLPGQQRQKVSATSAGKSEVEIKTPEGVSQFIPIGSDNDERATLDKQYQVTMNKNVWLLGSYDDQTMKNLLVAKPDGSYNLKKNIRVENVTPRLLYFLGEDFKSPNANYTLPKGTPLSEEYAKNLMKRTYGGKDIKVYTVSGYETSATTKDANGDELDVSVFIPTGQAPEIDNALKKGGIKLPEKSAW